MTPRSWWIAAALIVIIAYLIGLVILWQCIDRPYDKPDPFPAKIINAALGRHGNVTLVTAPGGLYFHRSGRRIWIVRR